MGTSFQIKQLWAPSSAYLDKPACTDYLTRSLRRHERAYMQGEQHERWPHGEVDQIRGFADIAEEGEVQVLEMFLADPETESIIMIGGIGGSAEEDAGIRVSPNPAALGTTMVGLLGGQHV